MASVTHRESSASLAGRGDSSYGSSHGRHPGAWLMACFWAWLLLAFPSSLGAQSPPAVRFLGVPAPVFTSGISFPIGMAADTSGNVYIAEYSGNAVYKETLQSNGSFVRSTVASGFPAGPVGLAIDSAVYGIAVDSWCQPAAGPATAFSINDRKPTPLPKQLARVR